MRLIDADALYKDMCNSMAATTVVGGEWLWRKLWDAIKYAPTIEPQRWIPCRERLPEEYGEYICTMENGQVQECGFVPENQRGLVDGWSTCEADGYKFLGYVDVLAWMPLPEPYRAERSTDE